ncbi:MAG: hypothetical protein GWP70_10940 [Proteobacteria bacterium]|nr:hypothetical protein [Pseudomonadota bacterium]
MLTRAVGRPKQCWWLPLLLLACSALLLTACAKPANPDTQTQSARGTVSATNAAINPASTADAGAALADYVGSTQCGQCHQEALTQWQTSHHAKAMAVPTADTVVADFGKPALTLAGTEIGFKATAGNYFIRLDGVDGQLRDFRLAYTFGVSPLQQYLVDIGRGRLQALPVVWDDRTQAKRWYHLLPDTVGQPADVQHWTASGQNWNHMCADCHSTAVTKGYAPATDSFSTQFAEVSVGCEACHGPGRAHSDNPMPTNIAALKDPAVRLDVCASCHSRRSQVAEGFAPGEALLDHYQPALLDQGLYFSDGQILDEVFVYGSVLQSKMRHAGVSCGDCHQPHSATLSRQGNEVCTACHSPQGSGRYAGLQAKVYDSPAHHFHAMPEPVGHAVEGTGAACVDCHMSARTYMGIDSRRDHSFRIPRPDLSMVTAAPNACTGCHAQQSAEWAAEKISAHFGTAPQPHFAPTIFAARQGKRQANSALLGLADDLQHPAIVRATALSLLQQYSAPSALMRRAFEDPDPLVRLGALRGFTLSGPEDVQSVLPLLADPMRVVRFAAVTVLLPAYRQIPLALRGQLDAQVEAYLAHLAANADRAEALTNRALVHLAKNDPVSAEADLQLALLRNPAWLPGLVNLADLYRGSGRDGQAGELLQRAMALAPEAPQVRVAYALWQVRQGQLDGAIEVLASGHKMQPHASSGYIYAVALSSAQRSAEALQVVDELLQADLYSPSLLQLGITLAQQSQSAEQLARYQAALQAL